MREAGEHPITLPNGGKDIALVFTGHMSGGDRVEALNRADVLPTERRIVGTLVSLLTLGLIDNQFFAPILPEIAGALGTDETMVGRTVVGYAIAAAAAALVVGPLSDRFGRRRFLVAAGAVFASGSLAVVVSGSLAAFATARVVTGGAAGIISALTVAAIADLVPYQRRGRAMGWVAMAYFAAPILGLPLAGWIAEHAGWRANYVLFAFGASLASIAVAFWFDDRNGDGVMMRQSPGYLRFLKSRSTAAGALSAFFVTGGLTGFLLFLSVYLRSRFQLSLTDVTLVLSFSGAASLVGAHAAGRLSDRIGKIRVALAGSGALAFFFVVVPETGGALLYATLGLVGLSAAARVAPLQSLVTQLVSQKERGAYVAFRNMLSQMGSASAAGLASSLYPYGFDYVCWMTAGYTVVGGVLLLLIDEPTATD